jgi:hypothetical protein
VVRWGYDVNAGAILAHPRNDVGAATWFLDFHRSYGLVV